MSAVEFLEPWHACADPAWVQELHRELSPGHLLHGQTVMPLARRQDVDDVLYALADGSGRVAQVHLTFRGKERPPFPITKAFESIAAWEETMRIDHAEFRR